MMEFNKCVYWPKFTVLFCFCVLLEVKNEELQCSKKHILSELEFEGLLNECRIISDGQNLTNSDCTVWEIGEDPDMGGGRVLGYYDCSNLQFSPGGAVPGIEIHPYLDRLNIHFRKITWHYMQYRMQVANKIVPKVCHRLQINESVSLLESLHLSFECQTEEKWPPGKLAEILVDVGNSPSEISGFAHFVMNIPPSKEHVDSSNTAITLGDWYMLVAVDVSQKPYLIAYWPAVPYHYNVSEYNVQVGDDEPEVVKLSSCENGYCFHRIFAGYSARNVTINVQPVHDECQRSCYSHSPEISLEFYLPAYLLVVIVSVPILIVIVIISSIYRCCCTAPSDPLKVLLLHDATTELHRLVVRDLAKYLKDVGDVRCLMAELEVPGTESQNASMWLHRTLDEVDAVLYIASPPSHMDIRYSKYPSVVYEALELIQKCKTCPAHQRPGRCLVAVPPYCSKENIPSCLLGAPRFGLPGELNFLLWALYNPQCWLPPFNWMAKVYLKCCWCPGPMSAYHQYGANLESAMNTANAKHVYDAALPRTPPASTIWTTFDKGDGTSQTTSTFSKIFPGRISKLALGGSAVSEEDKSETLTVSSLHFPGPMDRLLQRDQAGGSMVSKEDTNKSMSSLHEDLPERIDGLLQRDQVGGMAISLEDVTFKPPPTAFTVEDLELLGDSMRGAEL